jgi:hypothetical protein
VGACGSGAGSSSRYRSCEHGASVWLGRGEQRERTARRRAPPSTPSASSKRKPSRGDAVVTLACEGADCAAARSGVVSISNAARSSGRPKSRRKRPDPRGGERIGYGGAPPARQRRRRRCRVPAGRSSKVRKTSGEVRRTSTGLARACPGLNDRFGRCPGGRLQGYGWPSQAPEVLRATKWATYPMQTMRAVQTCIFLIWTSGYKSEGYVER